MKSTHQGNTSKTYTKQDTAKHQVIRNTILPPKFECTGQSDLIHKTQTDPKGSHRLCFIRMNLARAQISRGKTEKLALRLQSRMQPLYSLADTETNLLTSTTCHQNHPQTPPLLDYYGTHLEGRKTTPWFAKTSPIYTDTARNSLPHNSNRDLN